jgi:hypothetical protein
MNKIFNVNNERIPKSSTCNSNRLILGIRLAAAAILASGTLFAANASAETLKTSGDFKYINDGGEAVIKQYTGKASKLKIPAKIKKLKVKEIGYSAFKGNKKLKKVTIPEGVKLLTQSSFKGCKNLTEVKLPESLEKIYGYSFKNCIKLKKINLGSNIKVLGGECFAGCESLESITLPEKVTEIRTGCFTGCKKLKNINLENITFISVSAFENCTSLEGNIILDNVREVMHDAFNGCTKITGVRFSEALERLGSSPITPAENELRDVQGMGSSNTFGDCTALQNIEVSAANANFCSIDGILFGKSGEWLVAYPAGRTGEYTVPDKVKGIGDSAFMGSRLTKIILPDSVKSIFPAAFKNSAITEIRLPDATKGDVTYYGNDMYGNSIFDSCKNLVSFTFPEGMKTCKGIVFSGCTALKTVTFPSTMTELGGNLNNGMFSGCTSLETVNLPVGLHDIPHNCFKGCVSLKNINLENIGSVGVEAFADCRSLEGKLNLSSAGTIYARAFEGCTGITEASLPVSTSAIGVFPSPYTLSYEDYSEINDDNNPFGNCTSLANITIDENNSDYTVVDGCLYSKDMGHLISVPCAKTGKIIVPYGVATINPYSFYGSRAESVVIPSSTTAIAYNAFKDCTMKHLTIGNNVNRIDNADNTETKLTQGVFPGCTNLEDVIVNEGNNSYKSINGVLYSLRDDGSKTLICYPAAKKGKSFTTPKKTYIGCGAFSNCRYLKKLVISPKTSVKELPVIFNNCNGIKLYIPPVVKSFSHAAGKDPAGKYIEYNIFGNNCSRCKIYVKKKSAIEKKLKKKGISDYKYF